MLNEIITQNEVEPRARAMDMLIHGDFSKHPDLVFSTIGGSSSSNSHGSKSDIDIVTIMRSNNPNRVNVDHIIDIAMSLRQIGIKLVQEDVVIRPVFISTIRLEEAQITLAEIEGGMALPIHWLHYPSIQFAKTNEPVELLSGLIKGKSIKGDRESVAKNIAMAEPMDELSGLDWLTDSFRVLLTNAGVKDGQLVFQPLGFLKGLAMHNLEYFWKWKVVAKIVKEETGKDFENWNDMLQISNKIPFDIMQIVNRIREVRHSGTNSDIEEIVELHRKTFEMWPISI